MDINFMNVLLALLVLGILGLIFGLILAVASKIFEVKTDPRFPLIMDCLPGANCGGGLRLRRLFCSGKRDHRRKSVGQLLPRWGCGSGGANRRDHGCGSGCRRARDCPRDLQRRHSGQEKIRVHWCAGLPGCHESWPETARWSVHMVVWVLAPASKPARLMPLPWEKTVFP